MNISVVRELLAQRASSEREHLASGSVGGLRVDRGRAHGERHDERGAVAVARHVADHHARARAAQAEKIVEVAAHALGRHRRARPPSASGATMLRARQELHLQVVRERNSCTSRCWLSDARTRRVFWIAVPICVAMAAISFWSPALNGCSDERSERFTTPSGSMPPCGHRPHDRHAEHGAAPVARLGLARHVVSSSAIIARCSRKTRADTLALVVQRDRRNVEHAHADARRRSAGVSVTRSCTRIEPRRAPTVSEISLQDRGGRFLERDRATEDLA